MDQPANDGQFASFFADPVAAARAERADRRRAGDSRRRRASTCGRWCSTSPPIAAGGHARRPHRGPAAPQHGRGADAVRLGQPPRACSGGDNAGFPNGRRVFDDVTDIALRVVAGGVLAAPFPGFNADINGQAGRRRQRERRARTSRSSPTWRTRRAAAIAGTSIRPSPAAPRAEARHALACNGARSQREEGTPAPAGVPVPLRALKSAAFVERAGLHLPGRRCRPRPSSTGPPRRHERDRGVAVTAGSADRLAGRAAHRMPRARPSTCTPSASTGGTTSRWRWRAARARPAIPATTPRPGRPPSARWRSSPNHLEARKLQVWILLGQHEFPRAVEAAEADQQADARTMCWSTGSWRTATPSWAAMPRPRRRRSGCSTCGPATCRH